MFTVGLPTYRNADILWLALESLCRQALPPCPWELIICEEPSDKYCGPDYTAPYLHRLRLAGCERVYHVHLEKHTALEIKWKHIVRAMAPESEYLCLQGSDDYSNPNRLATTWRVRDSFDWFSAHHGVFYHARLRKSLYFTAPGGTLKSGPDIVIKRKYLQGIPDRTRNKGVDWFLLRHAHQQNRRLRKVYFDGPTLSVFTDGFNLISTHREKEYHHPTPPYSRLHMPMSNFLPAEVLQRLQGAAR